MKHRPTTKCRRRIGNGERCAAPLSAHDPVTFACPGGTGATFVANTGESPGRASASFSKPQLEALSFALRGLRENKDLRIFTRMSQRELVGVERIARNMLASMSERAEEDSAAPAVEERESSGATGQRQT